MALTRSESWQRFKEGLASILAIVVFVPLPVFAVTMVGSVEPPLMPLAPVRANMLAPSAVPELAADAIVVPSTVQRPPSDTQLVALGNLPALLGGAQLIASTSLTASGPSGAFTPSQFVRLPTIGGQPSGNPLGGQDFAIVNTGSGGIPPNFSGLGGSLNASTPGLGLTTPAGATSFSSTPGGGSTPSVAPFFLVGPARVTVGGVGLFPGNFSAGGLAVSLGLNPPTTGGLPATPTSSGLGLVIIIY